MKRTPLAVWLITLVLAGTAGWWGSRLFATHATESAPSQLDLCPDGSAPLYWKAPMDPTYVRDAPGKSPMGMDLVPECRSAAAKDADSAIVIDAATIQNMGVRTAPVERRDLARVVRAVGRVAYDERRVAHVHSKVQGWVEELFVEFVGQRVRKGEPLMRLYSPELVATQEELLLAARYRDATGASPFDEVRGGGTSLFDATRQRLALWDVPERDIERLLRTGRVERTLTLYAPATGVITHLGVRSGMELRPNTNLYTIADLSRVWVVADVYEYELPWLELGQHAEVELSYQPGQRLSGELAYIAPFLDPETRTVEVRLEIDNADGRLKPGMFGNALIQGRSQAGVLVVPSAAIIHSGLRKLAIVALGDGRFEPREVDVGLDAGESGLEILDGLREGERVVLSGQFLIDSESNLREASRKLLSDRAEPADPSDAGEQPRAEAPDDARVAPSPAMTHDHSALHGTEE